MAEFRAATDALTGLPNARSLRESHVKRMVAQAARSELPLAAVLLRPRPLQADQRRLRAREGRRGARGSRRRPARRPPRERLAGRYGGEEFLILLPDTPLDGAVALAEKIRDEVALVAVPGVDRPITASVGVASFPADTADGDTLIRIADRALYAAKSLGRNCVVTAAELLAGRAEPTG